MLICKRGEGERRKGGRKEKGREGLREKNDVNGYDE